MSNSSLVWSLKNGDLDQVKEFQVKANTNIDGRYPIHYAADYGQKEVIEFLLDQGADIDAVDKHGITPLLAAIWEGHTECVKLLLSRGANKNGKTPDGKSYIEAAEKQEIRDLLTKS